MTALGIELGSTRIKAVLTDECGTVLAMGAHRWENAYEGGYWTYALDDAIDGMQRAYAALAAQYKETHGTPLTEIGAIGISGMMHGYLPFDKDGNQLAAFRTWKNTVTGEAAAALSAAFGCNIPQRYSCAHLYGAILKKEEHLPRIAHINTLAGYIHERLTGERVLGIGDASGMLPIDEETKDYDAKMAATFDKMAAERGVTLSVLALLPKVLLAGEGAGYLTEEGARLLDPTGTLGAGIPFCPPEGDMQTGMAATNSVRRGTGNVSAGTSLNACIIPEKALARSHPEVDIVATPDGFTSLLLHTNNCTSELDRWASFLVDAANAAGANVTLPQMLTAMFAKAEEGAADAGGHLDYNYASGEPVMGLSSTRPVFIRNAANPLNFADFARTQLYSAVAVVRIGLDILYEREGIAPAYLVGHGGYFHAAETGARMMSAALGVPIVLNENAGEGGAWGMALLALYRLCGTGMPLADFLDSRIFAGGKNTRTEPRADDAAGFDRFLCAYKANAHRTDFS